MDEVNTSKKEESKISEPIKTESSSNETEPNCDVFEKKRVNSIKDKISMFSQSGAVPKKIIKTEDQVVPKSQVIKN